MGLLDGLLGANLDDPNVALSAGLLGGAGNWAANLGQGLLGASQMRNKEQADERLNRANELQQISGTYKLLKDMDNQAMLAAQFEGRQHVPNPLLQQIEGRLGSLAGQPSMAPMQPPQGMRPSPQMPTPAMQGMPQGQPQPAQSQPLPPIPPALPPGGAPQSPQGQPNLGQLADMAGVPKPVALSLIAAGKPDKLMELIAKGFEMHGSGGNFMQRNPRTGKMDFLGGQMQPNSFPVAANGNGGLDVLPVTGLNEAIAQQTAAKTTAEENAKAQFDVITLPDGNGGTRAMPRSQFLGGQQRAPLPPIPPARGKPGVAQLTVTEPGRGAVGQGINPGDIEQQKVLGKFYGDTFTEAQAAGKNAAAQKSKLDRMEQLLDGVNTGKFTPQGVEWKAAAESLGIKLDPNLGNLQAAEALANEIALSFRNPASGAGMPGSLSDADRGFLTGMSPGISKTPEGRKLIAQTQYKILDRQQDVARLSREYLQKHGKIDQGFFQELQSFADKNPLFQKEEAFSNVPGADGVVRMKYDTTGKRIK